MSQLPQYQYPGNAMLNFQPLSEGVDKYKEASAVRDRNEVFRDASNAMAAGDSATAQRLLGQVDPKLAMEAGLYQGKKESQDLDIRKQTAQLLGGHAGTILEFAKKDPEGAAAAATKWLASDPKFGAGLARMGMQNWQADPLAAVRAIHAEALGAQDPNHQALVQAQTGKANRENIEPGNRVVDFGQGQGQGRVVAQGDLSMKTPGERAQVAESMGLQKGSPDYTAIVVNGKLPDVVPDHKAIQEADNKVLASRHLVNDIEGALAHSKGMTGGIAATVAPVLNAFGGTENSQSVAQFNNMVQTSILPNLKSTFGARVTNTDLNLMKELAGAASQPQGVRDDILRRTIARAKEVQAEQEQNAAQLRGRTYYKAGGGPQQPGTVVNGPAAGPAVTKQNTDQLPQVERKVIDGKSYVKQNGQWFEE